MLVFGVSVFLNCVIERTPSLQWLTVWGFRLNMLYSEVSPHVCLCEVHLLRDASASVCGSSPTAHATLKQSAPRK